RGGGHELDEASRARVAHGARLERALLAGDRAEEGLGDPAVLRRHGDLALVLLGVGEPQLVDALAIELHLAEIVEIAAVEPEGAVRIARFVEEMRRDEPPLRVGARAEEADGLELALRLVEGAHLEERRRA